MTHWHNILMHFKRSVSEEEQRYQLVWFTLVQGSANRANITQIHLERWGFAVRGMQRRQCSQHSILPPTAIFHLKPLRSGNSTNSIWKWILLILRASKLSKPDLQYTITGMGAIIPLFIKVKLPAPSLLPSTPTASLWLIRERDVPGINKAGEPIEREWQQKRLR